MTQLFANNAVALLAAPISATSTSLTVQAGFGSKFPAPDVDQFFLITLEDESASTREIIKVTGRTGNTLTFSLADRGHEGTVPRNWPTVTGEETLVDLRVTAGTLTSLGSSTTSIQISDIVKREVPSGTLNGTNTSFSLSHTPKVGTVDLFVNGLLQEEGSGNDYTISGSAITMLYPLSSTDKLRASYFK